jgi:RNA polymerase sigma factor (sigma-70 family)
MSGIAAPSGEGSLEKMINPTEVRQFIRILTKRTGNPVFDEDLFQDALLHTLEAFHRTAHVRYPKAFVMKIVGDTVRDHWRRRHPIEDIQAVDERLLSVRPQIEDELDRRRRATQLHTAISTLAPAQRHLLCLYYEDDLSITEIAAAQKRSQSAVKMDLFRARRKLAKMMKERTKKKVK